MGHPSQAPSLAPHVHRYGDGGEAGGVVTPTPDPIKPKPRPNHTQATAQAQSNPAQSQAHPSHAQSNPTQAPGPIQKPGRAECQAQPNPTQPNPIKTRTRFGSPSASSPGWGNWDSLASRPPGEQILPRRETQVPPEGGPTQSGGGQSGGGCTLPVPFVGVSGGGVTGRGFTLPHIVPSFFSCRIFLWS